MKIIAVHLSNDFSESSKVLKQLVKGWTKTILLLNFIWEEAKKVFCLI